MGWLTCFRRQRSPGSSCRSASSVEVVTWTRLVQLVSCVGPWGGKGGRSHVRGTQRGKLFVSCNTRMLVTRACTCAVPRTVRQSDWRVRQRTLRVTGAVTSAAITSDGQKQLCQRQAGVVVGGRLGWGRLYLACHEELVALVRSCLEGNA
jgi:hypothetical protein